MNFLRAMLSESNGSPSSTRALAVIVCLVVMANWSYATVTGKPMAQLSWEAVALVGTGMGVKAWQRGREGLPGQGNGDTKIYEKH